MACQKVRIGEVSRIRQFLTGTSVAPGTDDIFRELPDRRPQVQRRELPREVLEHVPERSVVLDRKTFFDSLPSAPGGSSAGPGGCTYEHLKLMLDETDSQELLLATCNLLAQGKVPAVIGTALTGARLTALTKPNGGVREIATGCTVRRLVKRSVLHSSTPCPPERAQIVLDTCCEQPLMRTQTRQF